MVYSFQPNSPQYMLSGDIATLTFIMSQSFDPSTGTSVEDHNIEGKLLDYVEMASFRLRRDIEQAVQEQLGAEFSVRRMEVRRGSIEILVVLGTIGTAYVLVSRYKNFIESINVLVTQLRGIIERFMRNPAPSNTLTMQSSWAPGPALANPRRMPTAAEGWDMSKIVLGYLILSHATLLAVFIWMVVFR